MLLNDVRIQWFERWHFNSLLSGLRPVLVDVFQKIINVLLFLIVNNSELALSFASLSFEDSHAQILSMGSELRIRPLS